MGLAQELPNIEPQRQAESDSSVAKEETNLKIEEMRDHLYAKAIAPETSPEIKAFLNPFEIANASPERLQELQDQIIYPNGKPDNIIQFPSPSER